MEREVLRICFPVPHFLYLSLLFTPCKKEKEKKKTLGSALQHPLINRVNSVFMTNKMEQTFASL